MPRLVPVDLPLGVALDLPGRRTRYAHFIEEGFASVVIRVGEITAEIGLVGREGMLGTPAVIGAEVSEYTAIIRYPGYAFRITVEELRAALTKSETLQSSIMRFVQAGFVQVAYLAVANHHLSVTERLARWLLMASDRIDGKQIRLSHEVLATALSVRRAGVTVAIHELESAGAVRAGRNLLLITSYDILRRIAGPAYGPAERAYDLLFDREQERG